MTSKSDIFKECNNEFLTVGKLSSLLPAYVRQCCRSRFDGTDAPVLDTNRKIAMKMLMPYSKEYAFVPEHLNLLDAFPAMDVKRLISGINSLPEKDPVCMATMSSTTPKKACLHCPRVGQILDEMRDDARNSA